MMKKIQHQLVDSTYYFPIWEIEYLFLGTFNPSEGKKVNYYYGRPKNQFWKLISHIFCNIEFNQIDFADFMGKLKQNKIACVDMISSVNANDNLISGIIGDGYSDNKIINNSVKREYNTEKIIELINKNKSVKVFSTWGEGSKLKDWRNEIEKINKVRKVTQLASPSLVARVPEGFKKFDYMLKDWESKIDFKCP
jgi:hypothetical protein